MRFVVSADWHLKMWSDREFDHTGIPRRLQEILSCIEQLCDYCVKHRIENVIVAGDINDRKGLVDARSFVGLQRLLEKYSGLQFYLLHGNHDETCKAGLDSAIELLSGPENVTIVTKPLKVDNVQLVPHSKGLIDVLDELDECPVLVSHLALSEGFLSSGMSLRTSVSIRMLKKWQLVLLGDYHKPQQVGHVYYCGSPVQFKRDEAGEEKRFLVVDDDLKVASVPFSGSRRYWNLEINDNSEADAVLKEAKTRMEQGDFVRVIKHTEEALPKKLVESVPLVEAFEPDHQTRGITLAMSLEEQMKRYLELEKIPESEWDEYLRIGLEASSKAGIQ